MKTRVVLVAFLLAVWGVFPTVAKDMTQAELLRVGAGGLKELHSKVSTRDDVTAEIFDTHLVRYRIDQRFEVYYFTEEGHPAHPTAVFRGRVERPDGTSGFDQRAWSAALDMEAVEQLIGVLQSRDLKDL